MYIKFTNCSFANKNKISYLKRTKKVKTKKKETILLKKVDPGRLSLLSNFTINNSYIFKICRMP